MVCSLNCDGEPRLPDRFSGKRRHPLAAANLNRRQGAIGTDVLQIAALLLHDPRLEFMARRVGWGRAAESVVEQAL